MKLVYALALVCALVIPVQACKTASAEVPTVRSLATLVTSVDSLKVRSTWSASTVPTPPAASGPITYQVTWTRNSATVRTATVSGLADTAIITPRAAIGAFDTVKVSVASVYQGRVSAASVLTKVFAGADARMPSVPIITTVDSI